MTEKPKRGFSVSMGGDRPEKPKRGFSVTAGGGERPEKPKRGFSVSAGRKPGDEPPGDGVSKGKAIGSLVKLGTDFAIGAISSLLPGRRDGIATDPGARRREIAKMGATVGRTMTTAKVGSIGRSTEQREEIRKKATNRATNQVIEALGNMKGLAMKLGQLASYAATLSDEAEEQLAVLQITSDPIPYEAIAQVVVQEFGKEPDELFAWFDDEPIAAASVGQVHRARTHDGQDVAVKVQYPGVEDAIISDLQNLTELATVASLSGGHLEIRGLYDEIGTLVREELDYRREARNQIAFAERYRGHPRIKIPEVFTELSSLRVLTTEFVPGRTLYEVLASPEGLTDAYGETIYRFAFDSVLQGAFSGDPHPGNYVFCEDGRVCFLDFGLVKKLDENEQALVRALADAAVDGAGIAPALEGLGLYAEGVDPDELWAQLCPLTFGPVGTDAPVRLSKPEYREHLKAMQDQSSAFARMMSGANPPGWLTVLVRYGFGTMAVIAKLGAEQNWRRMMKELQG